MSLEEKNVPAADLSDLNAPRSDVSPARRGAGLANLIPNQAPPAPPAPGPDLQPAPSAPAPTPSAPAPQSPAVAVPDSSPAVPAPASEAPAGQQGTARKGKPISGVYVTEGVKKRFEKYRYDHKLTNVQVVLQAVYEKHAELPQILEQSAYNSAPVNPLFPADPKAVKYVGGGSAQVTFKPTPEQAKKLDELGKEMGFDKRSTWLAPVLNSFLPGRKETKRE